jgi:hypothetical protein
MLDVLGLVRNEMGIGYHNNEIKEVEKRNGVGLVTRWLLGGEVRKKYCSAEFNWGVKEKEREGGRKREGLWGVLICQSNSSWALNRIPG